MKLSNTYALLAGFAASLASLTSVHAQDVNDISSLLETKPTKHEYYTLFIENTYRANLKMAPDNVFTIYRTAKGDCVVGTDEFKTANQMQSAMDIWSGLNPSRVTERVEKISVEKRDAENMFDPEKRAAYIRTLKKCNPR